MVNLPELKAAIARSGVKKGVLAEHLGLCYAALCNRLTGKTEFRASEIERLAYDLHLSPEDVWNIFFSGGVI